MADNKENEKEEIKEESPQKQSKLNLYLVAFVPMILMFLGFFLVTKFINPRFGVGAGTSSVVSTAEAENTKESKENSKKKKGKEESVMIAIGPVLANPFGTGGKRFVRVGIGLELESKELAKKVEESKSKLQHELILILSAKDVDSLSSPQGKIELQEEIKKGMRSELEFSDEELPQIYFNEFIVQ
ncbi:MAG: Flagellar protein FliL [Candidatus Poribacteria bacterium]|nr:Flagellar protein FliL [Candidatus Poribacteria bacterium]